MKIQDNYKTFSGQSCLPITSEVDLGLFQSTVIFLQKNYGAKFEKPVKDPIPTVIYADFNIGEHKLCLHYDDMAGLDLVAMSERSEEVILRLSQDRGLEEALAVTQIPRHLQRNGKLSADKPHYFLVERLKKYGVNVTLKEPDPGEGVSSPTLHIRDLSYHGEFAIGLYMAEQKRRIETDKIKFIDRM